MQRIRKAIERLDLRGEVANQKRIIEELGKDENGDLARGKIISLLKRGTGIHWRTEKGMHNATLYYPISVFQFSEPIDRENWKTDCSSIPTLPGHGEQKLCSELPPQINTGFTSFPQFSKAPGKQGYSEFQTTGDTGKLSLAPITITEEDLQEVSS